MFSNWIWHPFTRRYLFLWLFPSQVEDVVCPRNTLYFKYDVLLKVCPTYLLLWLQISDPTIFGQRRFCLHREAILRELIFCNLGKMNDSGMLSHKLYFAITPKKKIWGHCERRSRRNIRSEERGLEWSWENSHWWKWLGCHYQAHDSCDYLHVICTRLDLPLKLLKERTLKVIPQKK